MLVFLSDIHFTDGTSGETIHSGAFRGFVQDLSRMARDAKARDLEVVLLGDPSTPAPASAGGLCSGFRSTSGTKGATGLPVGLHIFDLIRSEQWIKSKIRPWDEKSQNQEQITKKILQGILKNAENRRSLNYLRSLLNLRINGKKIPVRMTYLIGNHDWLINRYRSSRELVRNALGITSKNPFAWGGYWKDYKVFARHGRKATLLPVSCKSAFSSVS